MDNTTKLEIMSVREAYDLTVEYLDDVWDNQDVIITQENDLDIDSILEEVTNLGEDYQFDQIEVIYKLLKKYGHRLYLNHTEMDMKAQAQYLYDLCYQESPQINYFSKLLKRH